MEKSPQVITCKGAVCWGQKEGVKVEEIQVDPPQRCEIRVKMLYASVCHTDFSFMNGLNGVPGNYPRVLGHEGVGVVESVGEGVRGLKEGDTVIPTYVGECGECENCVSGHTNLCFTYPLTVDGRMVDGTTRMSVRGQKLHHMMSCSTWCEYMVINANYVVKLDPSINLAHASFLSCGFSTGYGAVWKESNVGIGSSVAVFGLGAVGLGVVEGARQQGATRIIGIDTNEKKREKGEAFGMTHFVNPQDHNNKPISEIVRELTDGRGVDYCMECTGVDHLVNQAIQATKVGGGSTIIIGASSSEIVEINIRALLSYGRSLKGTIFGGIKTKSDLPFLIHKCINKEIQLDALLTHEIALEDTSQVFAIFKRSDCVKVLIKISN